LVHVSIGARQTPLPQRIAGRDLFRYLDAIGLMRVPVESRLGQRLRYRETLIGSSPRAAREQYGIRLRDRTVDAQGAEVVFEDGGRLAPAAVIWATGFAVDDSWVHVPVFDDGARLMHHRGVTCSPGLYFLGLTWQHTRGSALLGWVRDDADLLARRIAAHATTTAANGARQPSPAEAARS
jgi:putative flavoprotein involved in K+ transport